MSCVDDPGRAERRWLRRWQSCWRCRRERPPRAGLFPTNPSLTQLAEAVAARERRHGRPVSTVRVEVWATHFSGEPLRATERRIRSLVLAVPAEAP